MRLDLNMLLYVLLFLILLGLFLGSLVRSRREAGSSGGRTPPPDRADDQGEEGRREAGP